MNEFKLDLGCTFSKDLKKHFSTPQSPRQQEAKPALPKFDIFANLSKELSLGRRDRMPLNTERPRLIRERFGSKQLQHPEEKRVNLWK